MSKTEAIAAIKRKLTGKKLNSREIFSLMDAVAHRRLGPILTTYFAAAGFSQGFSNEELYYLTKAMVETGAQLQFDGIVADKHSIGGLAGSRTTMIIVPIIAAAGIIIPKTSSRAITTAAGTADTMEVLAKVDFTPQKIKKIIARTNGCIVWNGKLGFAPADDVIIQVEKPLVFESFDKIIVSVMAKKVAVNSTHIVIDLPVGPFMKVRHKKDAILIGEKFHYLAGRFGIKLIVDVNHTLEPAGFGIGPILEVKDVLAILEQAPDRPRKLEEKSLRLAAKLLDLCFAHLPKAKQVDGQALAKKLIVSGKALAKLREIVRAQGGNADFSQSLLIPGKARYAYRAGKAGIVRAVNTKQVNTIARILGSPTDKKAGVKLHFRRGNSVGKNDILMTLYSSDKWRLREAKESLAQLPVYYLEA